MIELLCIEAIKYASENGHSSVVELLLVDLTVIPAVDKIMQLERLQLTATVSLLMADPRVYLNARDHYAIKYASTGLMLIAIANQSYLHQRAVMIYCLNTAR